MIARSAIVALAVAGSAIVLSAMPRQEAKANAASDAMVAVGVACGDGTFVPLAARRRGTWIPLTTTELGDRSVGQFYSVLTADALRLPRRGWTLYPPRSGNSRPLILKAPRRDEVTETGECFVMQPFDSDAPRLPGRVACRGCTQLLPQVGGIGVLGPARFERGEDVTAQPDEESRRIAARIVREVHAAERSLDRKAGEYSPLRQFEGRKVGSVVRLLSTVRLPTNDGHWYFFQARKTFREPFLLKGRRLVREAHTNVNGWVRVSPVGMSAFVEYAAFDDDGAKLGRTYELVGVLVLANRTVWIAEGSGYESMWYELFELGPRDKAPHSVVEVMVNGS